MFGWGVHDVQGEAKWLFSASAMHPIRSLSRKGDNLIRMTKLRKFVRGC